MTHWCVGHDLMVKGHDLIQMSWSFIVKLARAALVRDLASWLMTHDSWLIGVCDMTDWCVRHDSIHMSCPFIVYGFSFRCEAGKGRTGSWQDSRCHVTHHTTCVTHHTTYDWTHVVMSHTTPQMSHTTPHMSYTTLCHVTWLTNHDSLTCTAWLIHMIHVLVISCKAGKGRTGVVCDIRKCGAWHDKVWCVTSQIMSHSCLIYIYATWLIHMCDETHWGYAIRFLCNLFFYLSAMRCEVGKGRTGVWHDSCLMTHSYMTHLCDIFLPFICDSFVCDSFVCDSFRHICLNESHMNENGKDMSNWVTFV